jgi:hypothetical protein
VISLCIYNIAYSCFVIINEYFQNIHVVSSKEVILYSPVVQGIKFHAQLKKAYFSWLQEGIITHPIQSKNCSYFQMIE